MLGFTEMVAPRRRSPAGREISLSAVLCVLLLVGGACGGGESQPIVFDSRPPTTTAPPTTGAPTTEAPTTTSPQPELGPWVDVTANLAGLPSECGNMSQVAAHPGNDQVIAGVALQGLWANTSGSDQWTRLGNEGQITNRSASIIFDREAPSRFWESGHYGGAGAFRTVDGGRTFEALGDIGHLDGLSVDLSDPQRRTLLAGSHERADLFRSTDGGATWANLAPRLPPAIGFASQPLVLSAQVHLLGTYGAPGAGIFRSTDGGANWQHVGTSGVAGPPLVARDGSIYWLLAGGGGLVRTTDEGVTWTPVTPPGVLASHNLVELADGRLASLARTHAIVSADHGRTWQRLGPPLPPIDAYGLTYSEQRNAVFIWKWDCGDVVPPESVHRLDLTPPGG